MKLAWILIVAALGCGKKDSGNEAAKTTDKPAAGSAAMEKPAEPFKGPLTVDLVMSAKDIVKPLEPWDAGFAKLQAKLGPPTKVEGDKYQWAAEQGDDCAMTYVSKDDAKKLNMGEGFVVGTVMPPMKAGKDAPSGNRDMCLKVLGKDSGPPEDPNAAAPPADGKATPAMIMDNAVKARSKWKGAKVTVTGTLASISTSSSTSDGKTTTTTTLTLADAKDKDKTIGCSLDAGTTKFTQGKPVTVSGEIDIEKWTSGAGTDTFKPAIKNCQVAK